MGKNGIDGVSLNLDSHKKKQKNKITVLTQKNGFN